ncbi:MAG: ABC transporter permease [Caldilineaceae bacterium]
MGLSQPRKNGAPGWRRTSNREDLRLWLVALPVLLFLLLPILALLLRVDPVNFFVNLSQRTIVQAIWLSLSTSTLTVVFGICVATPAAWLLARRRVRGRLWIDTLIDLPTVMPPTVAGIALLMAFGRNGLVGRYLDDIGISIAFSTAAVILAQMFVALPFYLKSAITGFAEVPTEFEEAAAVDGASALWIFWHITLPLASRSLLTGIVLTWARALGEFGATILFAGNFPGRTQTMPLAIYVGFELDLSVALTLSAILLVISFSVLFVVKRVLGKRE